MGTTTNQEEISPGGCDGAICVDVKPDNDVEIELDRAVSERLGDFFKNATLLVLLFGAYLTVRSVTADEFTTAMLNATDVLRVQESLGLPSELSFQQALIGQRGFVKAANIYYIAVHFPLTIAFLVWVWLSHRTEYNRVRNTLISVTGAGLVMHLVYPLAPPRMIDGFVDTAAWLGPNPYDMAVSTAANQIAAMPSLHVGWSLLVAISVIWIFKTRWRWLALIHPTVTSAVVVVTANHYWSDAIVAALLVFVGWLVFSPGLIARFFSTGSATVNPPAASRQQITAARQRPSTSQR